MKKLLILLLLLVTSVTWGSDWVNPYDPGAARNTLSNVTPATGRTALGLGTISTKADTDYVATSTLALRLDTGNASFSKDIDVTGDVGAATLGITGHSTLTTASATALSVTGRVRQPTGGYGSYGATREVFILTADASGGIGTIASTSIRVVAPAIVTLTITDVSNYKNGIVVVSTNSTNVTSLLSNAGGHLSVTKDNASTINVYMENGSIMFQNNHSADAYLYVLVDGITAP